MAVNMLFNYFLFSFFVIMISTTAKNSCNCFRGILSAPVHHKKLSFVIVLLLLVYSSAGKNVKNKNFDYLIFSQRWLPTSCIEYIEHNSSHQHRCVLPKNFEVWTIHGLWPTQYNHIGPFFCNSSLPFNYNKLHVIESDLKLYWPNIEGGETVSSLWDHEWLKHGTCACMLESLNSELKYFNTTLNIFKGHNINDLFKRYPITPSPVDGFNILDLFKIIGGTFGKLPQIKCFHEVKTKQPYLSEIRLCYNKNLELMDCGHIPGNKFNSMLYLPKGLTNCPLEGKVIYPSNINLQVDNLLSENPNGNTYFYSMLLDILYTLRFLMWASI